MKGKIDKDGYLFIERAGEMAEQLCPSAGTRERRCGDWCPKFHEPCKLNAVNTKEAKTELWVCGTGWIFTDFTDERGKP